MSLATQADAVDQVVSPTAALGSRRTAIPVQRRARAALILLTLATAAIQPALIPAAHVSARMIWDRADVHTLWQQYRSTPAPEVLFLGASSTRMDVDTDEIARLLSAPAGRHVTIGKFGVNGEGPDFYVAALQRILSLPTRPHLVIIQTDQLVFNSSELVNTNQDLWLMSDPFDAGYMRTALRVSPEPARLALSWAVPFFATYLLDGIDKSVFRAPLVPMLKPAWHFDNRTTQITARRLTALEQSPSWVRFAGVAASAIRG